MPLYLDVHNKVEGATTDALAHAHRKDLEVQHKYGVNYLRYWFDEGTGKVFCLVEAPSKEAAAAVPTRLIEELALVGPADKIRHDLDAWRDSLATTLLIGGDAATLRTAAELVLG